MPGDAAAIMTIPNVRSAPRCAFARVEVHHDAEAVMAAWGELEASTPCSIYQTRAWLLPWIETLGRKTGIEPFFVLARAADDRPLALLSLGTVQRGPFRIASWLGGSDANFNMPLARPDVTWTRADLIGLLDEAAKASRRRPDLFNLVNQPLEWHGRANPLALLAHQPSPSAAFGTTLSADPEAFFAGKLSKDSRKKLRKKGAKLAALGPVDHLVVTDADTQRRVLDAFLAQKIGRFRTQKITSDFETPEMRAFLEAASWPRGGGIELHALRVGERIVAIYGGAAHDGQWSGMFNSFESDDEIAKLSPGDLLLLRIIAWACAKGLTGFDLGIGEARYKEALCDERIALFDVIIPTSLAGRIAAQLIAGRQRAKRLVKANPRLLAYARRIKALGF